MLNLKIVDPRLLVLADCVRKLFEEEEQHSVADCVITCKDAFLSVGALVGSVTENFVWCDRLWCIAESALIDR